MIMLVNVALKMEQKFKKPLYYAFYISRAIIKNHRYFNNTALFINLYFNNTAMHLNVLV